MWLGPLGEESPHDKEVSWDPIGKKNDFTYFIPLVNKLFC